MRLRYRKRVDRLRDRSARHFKGTELPDRAVLKHLAKKGGLIGDVNIGKGGTSRRSFDKTNDTASADLFDGVGKVVIASVHAHYIIILLSTNRYACIQDCSNYVH